MNSFFKSHSKKIIISLITVVVTIAAAFFTIPYIVGVDGFRNEEAKQEAWLAYLCNNAMSLTPSFAAASASTSVLADEAASNEDKIIATDIALYQQYGAEAVETVPLTVSAIDDGTCNGWVWEKYLKYYPESNEEYENFTYSKAEEAGIIEK